jgi:hypothetical protein
MNVRYTSMTNSTLNLTTFISDKRRFLVMGGINHRAHNKAHLDRASFDLRLLITSEEYPRTVLLVHYSPCRPSLSSVTSLQLKGPTSLHSSPCSSPTCSLFPRPLPWSFDQDTCKPSHWITCLGSHCRLTMRRENNRRNRYPCRASCTNYRPVSRHHRSPLGSSV